MRTWAGLYWILRSLPYGTTLRIARPRIGHPAAAGAARSSGLPLGQLEDWRFPPDPACRGMHARMYKREWRVHLDRVHPSCSLLDHFFRDVWPMWAA
jgi:hypothetical protein